MLRVLNFNTVTLKFIDLREVLREICVRDTINEKILHVNHAKSETIFREINLNILFSITRIIPLQKRDQKVEKRNEKKIII